MGCCSKDPSTIKSLPLSRPNDLPKAPPLYAIILEVKIPTYQFRGTHTLTRASLVAQMVKNPPAMKDAQIQSLGWEDPLEKPWQPTPVFLPAESHGQKSLAGYSSQDHTESDTLK